MSRRSQRFLLAASALVLAVSCGSAGPVASGDRVIYNAEPSTGPFVVVAVDNHFHDIHPVDRTRISKTRPFVVKNEGGNLHNFTVVGTGITVDIAPRHSLRWARLGDHLRPGFYQVICKYHDDLGMRGSFFVTG